jgi:hypothetical protein
MRIYTALSFTNSGPSLSEVPEELDVSRSSPPSKTCEEDRRRWDPKDEDFEEVVECLHCNGAFSELRSAWRGNCGKLIGSAAATRLRDSCAREPHTGTGVEAGGDNIVEELGDGKDEGGREEKKVAEFVVADVPRSGGSTSHSKLACSYFR